MTVQTDRIAGISGSLAVKSPVVTMALTNIILSGEQVINGVAVVSGNRVGAAGQTDPVENGIWNVSTTGWTRAKDFNGARDVVTGTTVRDNNLPGDYSVSTAGDPTPGQDAIDFVASGSSSATGITYLRTATGANTRTLQSRLEDRPNILDFIPSGQHAAIKDGTSTYDGTSDFQAAIDEITGFTDGGTLDVPYGQYVLGDVVIKNKVRILGETRSGYPEPSTGPMTQLIGLSGASWIIDTPVGLVSSVSISGVSFKGTGVGNGQGGLRLRLAKASSVANCSFNDFDEQAILGDSVGTCLIKDNKAQNCLLDRSRAAKSGVLQISGSDNWIVRGEYTASSSLEGAISDANLRICAVALIGTGGNNWLSQVVGEISDIGFYIEGSDHDISGCRADLNYAHGYQIACQNSIIRGNRSLKNGRHANATYNDFDVISGSAVNDFIGNKANAGTDANRTNFAFADVAIGDSTKDTYVGNAATGQRAGTYSMNDTSGGGVTVLQGPAKSLTDLDLTPSVDNYGSFRWVSPSTFTVTDFDDGVAGQIISVINQSNSLVSVANGTNIFTSTGATKALTQNTVYRFFNFLGKWYEIAAPAAAAVSDPAGGGTVDAEARTAIVAIIDALQGADLMK